MLDRLADDVEDPIVRAKVLACRDVGHILAEDTLHLSVPMRSICGKPHSTGASVS